MKEQYIEAGEIVNTHGIRGEVRIQPWTDSAEFLAGFKTLYIDGAPRRVVSARPHKGLLLALFEGVEDVNAAMRLRGRRVFISRDEAELPPGHFFLQDIIGARVVDETGAPLGTLEEVLDTPANRVYVVRGAREHLIPALPQFVLHTDVQAGLITVRLIEGM